MEREGTWGGLKTLLPPTMADGWCVAGAWSEGQMGDTSPYSGCHGAQALWDQGELGLHARADIHQRPCGNLKNENL